MASIEVHVSCRRPLAECDCPDDGEPDKPAPAPRRRGRRIGAAGLARRGLLPRSPVVTVNVAGSVATQQYLVRAVQAALIRTGPHARPGPGSIR